MEHNNQAPAASVPADRDAERWRIARQFLAVEDIEAWAGRDWKGHQPTEDESAKADAAIDAIRALKGKPAAPAASKSGLNDAQIEAERALFEEWAVNPDEGGWVLIGALNRNPVGDEFDYRNDDVEAEWRAWRARAQCAAPAAPLTVPQGWIPVNDPRKPEFGERVLVLTTNCDDDPHPVTANYNGKSLYLGVGGKEVKPVTHWMRIPDVAAPAVPASVPAKGGDCEG